MTTSPEPAPASAADLDHLLKLRLVVARFGEMDLAKWWNTRGQLGRLGTATLRRGFPRTYRFAQARSVFAVAVDAVFDQIRDLAAVRIATYEAKHEEVEHDLGYKPLSGELSAEEQDLLVNLGHAIRSSDGMITQLLAATDRRQAEQTNKFSDVYDFVSRVRGWFPGTDFGRHSGALFEALRPLGFHTLDSIRKVVDLPAPLGPGATRRLEALSRDFEARGETRFELDPNSSDLLLVAMLPRIARYLTSSQPSTTPTEGTTRVRWFAERFLDLQQGKPDA